MELKDMILSTIAELEDVEHTPKKEVDTPSVQKVDTSDEGDIITDEKLFLKNVKEKVLVLFEGLQSPKNDNLDVKLDITLNFLEFLLASIEERMQQIK